MTEYDSELAWRILKGNFDASKPRRMIKGVVISSASPNTYGDALPASGMDTFKEPVPLLLEHDPMRPLGRVIRAWKIGDRVHFEAELAHSLNAAEQVWEMICAKEVMCASQGSTVTRKGDGTIYSWHLDEISLVAMPADLGAFINKCYTRLPFISLKQPQENVIWSI